MQTFSDWASCKSARRSNSGGWVFRGRHLLHHWCRVQGRVALSTGEAALHAQIQGLQELLSLKYLMEELRPSECRALKCVAEVDSTACKGIMLRHRVGQLKHLATRTMWTQQILQQEGIEVRRISRAVNSADCPAAHNPAQDLYGAVVQMVGVLPGANLDDHARGFLQCRCIQRDESEVPVPSRVPIPVSLQGTHVSKAVVVSHLSELVPTLDGCEKCHVGVRRPGASRAPLRGGVWIPHSSKSFTSGMLGSAETIKIQAGVSENWATVSGGDAEFIKTRRSNRQGCLAHVLRRVSCEQQLDSQRV